MDCGKARAIRNFVEYANRPFTAETVSEETGIDLKYTIKMLVFLRETQVVQAVSKEGKWNIYVKDNTPEDEKPLNRYGYDKVFMRQVMIEIVNGRISSQRDLADKLNCTHHKIVYYLQAMASAGVLGVRDMEYTVTDSGNLGAVGYEVDSQVFRKLKKKAVERPGRAVSI